MNVSLESNRPILRSQLSIPAKLSQPQCIFRHRELTSKNLYSPTTNAESHDLFVSGGGLSEVHLQQSCSKRTLGVFRKQRNILSKSCEVHSPLSGRKVHPSPDDDGNQGFLLQVASGEEKRK